MLFVFFCSGDLSFGFPMLTSPNFVLRLFTSSKAILPLCISLKICSGPLKLIKFIGEVLPLKKYVNLLKSFFSYFFRIYWYNNHHNALVLSLLILLLSVLKILKFLRHQPVSFLDLQLYLFVF